MISRTAASRGNLFSVPALSRMIQRMTLDRLAQAMRGMPRDALIMIRTPEGLRKLVWVKAAHIGHDGMDAGAGSGGRYGVILEHDGIEPKGPKL